LTGEAGAHPVATGVGAAAVGAAGLAVGAAVAGPIGVAVATAGGAFIGGYVGKALGEVIDPTSEEAFWREEHRNQPYAETEVAFDDYAPAYRVGYLGYHKFGGRERTFEDAERDLEESYNETRARVPWMRARVAAKAAWDRVHHNESRKPVETGVSEAVLSRDVQTGALSNAQMPR
jgi:hypothetical protein